MFDKGMMNIDIDWTSFVLGAFATWVLMVILCAVTAALERIAESYSKGPDEPITKATETAGRIELIDGDAPTPHEFGAPLADEYVEKARREKR